LRAAGVAVDDLLQHQAGLPALTQCVERQAKFEQRIRRTGAGGRAGEAFEIGARGLLIITSLFKGFTTKILRVGL